MIRCLFAAALAGLIAVGAAWAGPPPANVRAKLSGTRVYWVVKTATNPAASDSNDCLTFSTSCLTIQGAINKATGAVDTTGNPVYIQPYGAPATFSEAITVAGPLAGNGILVISGQGGGVTISSPNANATVGASNGAQVLVQGVTLTSTGGACLAATVGASVNVTNMSFGNCSGTMIDSASNATVFVGGGVVIAGNALSFLHANSLGNISLDGTTVTCTGSPAFSQYFAGLSGSSYIEAIGASFSGCGSVTGYKYTVNRLGSVRTNTNNLNFFPGSLPGTVLSNGVFDDYGTGGDAIRLIATGASDTAFAGDQAVLWKVSGGAAKTEVLPACGTTGPWQAIKIGDDFGDAATANITVTAASSGTINKTASFVMNKAFQVATFRCDGSGNYLAN